VSNDRLFLIYSLGIQPFGVLYFQQQVQAKFDFKPKDQEEMELKRGDIVTIIHKKDPNWWKGEIVRNNKLTQGLFPMTYVQPYTGKE